MAQTSENILIGRKANGDKVYVKARFQYPYEAKPGTRRTAVDHSETLDRLRFAITGTVVSKYGSITHGTGWVGCGQTRDDLLELSTLANGRTVADVVKLHTMWSEWHLNDAQPGCAHQSHDDQRDCPETGYHYGSAWLYKRIPYDVFKWICDTFDIEPPEPGSEGTF